MRISDWSSDVCSSDLPRRVEEEGAADREGDFDPQVSLPQRRCRGRPREAARRGLGLQCRRHHAHAGDPRLPPAPEDRGRRSEEHTSELQSLMRISYAVFCLKKKKKKKNNSKQTI